MNPPLRFRIVPAVAAFSTLCVASTWADVKLPSIISDNMVLQQETKANVWGWAEPGEKVSVKFAGQTLNVITDTTGNWSVKFDELKAGTTGDLAIEAHNSLSIKNVAVGEVWVCSGQSNMEFTVRHTMNAEAEIAAANFPMLRTFTVQRAAKDEPQKDCVGKWEVCTPETVPSFTAVGYFFGRKLHEALKAPIGLIHTSWGGTPAEFWAPKDVLAANPDFKSILENWDKVKEGYPKAKEAYEVQLAKWKEAAALAKTEGKPAPRPPGAPRGGDAFGGPGCLFNGMIAPIVPYTIQGATWYQGESNAGRAKEYRTLFPTMILSWRQLWNVEFPFLFVQLANYNPRKIAADAEPGDSQWAELREAQLMTLELPHTGMAVAIDVGNPDDIHPTNKQEVGRRLALAAEASVYFREVSYSGPILTSSQVEENKIRLSFRHSEGLKPASGDKFKGFAIAGEDKKFIWAEAEVQGDHLVISSAKVAKPVAVRYGWGDNPDCNLVNAENLPASPFRTDTWDQVLTPVVAAVVKPAAPAAPAPAK